MRGEGRGVGVRVRPTLGKRPAASSCLTPGTTMQLPPAFQSTGVATCDSIQSLGWCNEDASGGGPLVETIEVMLMITLEGGYGYGDNCNNG